MPGHVFPISMTRAENRPTRYPRGIACVQPGATSQAVFVRKIYFQGSGLDTVPLLKNPEGLQRCSCGRLVLKKDQRPRRIAGADKNRSSARANERIYKNDHQYIIREIMSRKISRIVTSSRFQFGSLKIGGHNLALPIVRTTLPGYAILILPAIRRKYQKRKSSGSTIASWP